MIKSSVNYKRPIVGLQKILAQSHVSEIKGGITLVIPFLLLNENEEKTYADGVLEYSIIDMNTKKTTVGPEWLTDLFFEKL